MTEPLSFGCIYCTFIGPLLGHHRAVKSIIKAFKWQTRGILIMAHDRAINGISKALKLYN